MSRGASEKRTLQIAYERLTAHLEEQTATVTRLKRELEGSASEAPAAASSAIQGDSSAISFKRGYDLFPPLANLTEWQKESTAKGRTGPHTLVAMTVGEKGRHSVSLILRKFAAFPDYAFLLFVYDGSTWTTECEAIRDRVTLIYAKAQFKFWFYRKFLLPNIVAAYEYLYVLDEDVCLNECGSNVPGGTFDIERYATLLRTHNIPLACPAHKSVHKIFRATPENAHIAGRWASIVEIGPFFSVSSHAWRLLFPLFVEEIVLGIGLDLAWCKYLALQMGRPSERTCAVMYQDAIVHLDSQSSRKGSRPNIMGMLHSGAWESGLLAKHHPHVTIGTDDRSLSVFDTIQ